MLLSADATIANPAIFAMLAAYRDALIMKHLACCVLRPSSRSQGEIRADMLMDKHVRTILHCQHR